jgi:hypothetical protein
VTEECPPALRRIYGRYATLVKSVPDDYPELLGRLTERGYKEIDSQTALLRSDYDLEIAGDVLLEPGFLSETPDRDFGPLDPRAQEQYLNEVFIQNLVRRLHTHPNDDPEDLLERLIPTALAHDKPTIMRGNPADGGIVMNDRAEVLRRIGHIVIERTPRRRTPPPPEGVTPEQWVVFRRLMNEGADLVVIREIFETVGRDLRALQEILGFE